jgi:uncharacterized membrane protein SpoIIM required for sporulation
MEIPEIDAPQLELLSKGTHNASTEVVHLLSTGDNQNAFVAIFKNNIKGCILNIVGGAILGLGTLINLSYNGFVAADMFVTSCQSGVNLSTILRVTLPHSAELVGFWFSGTIGFSIAHNIILFMTKKESFTNCFYKQAGLYSLIIFVIILVTAYIEAYVSISLTTK